ncbi:hypothetical protein FACS1894181_13990 [Bacteroidia bacterium]|nr:hypothetical protein FACS1894181_13990 [Bacteroidia bacterium]
MRKGFYIVLSLIAMMIAFSCNNNGRPSYPEMLEAQKKAINRLIADSGYVILKEYPQDGIFKANEFFQLDESDVYLNVVDSGNGNRAVVGFTTILCRGNAKGLMSNGSILGDTGIFENMSNTTYPIVYKYGSSAATSSDGFSQYFFSIAMFSPLEYVGDSSEVKLIIPFQSSSESLANSGEPVFFQKLRYRFEIR